MHTFQFNDVPNNVRNSMYSREFNQEVVTLAYSDHLYPKSAHMTELLAV